MVTLRSEFNSSGDKLPLDYVPRQMNRSCICSAFIPHHLNDMKLLTVLFPVPFPSARCSHHPQSACIHDLRSLLGEGSYWGLVGYDTA
jgi:hypothetical protein